MTSYSFPPSATICPWVRNNVIPHLSSLLAFSDFNFPPDAPTRSRSRTYIVLASADGEKQQKEAARGIETEPLEMLDLKFGHPIGENPKKTFPQVCIPRISKQEKNDFPYEISLHQFLN